MSDQPTVKANPNNDGSPLSFRYQIRFAKTMDLVWIGHQDLMRVMERLIRRGSIPVAHSQGFNPRPKVNFIQALGLGIEAYREVLEMELDEWMDTDDLLERLNEAAPPGLNFLSVIQLTTRRSALASSLIYTLAVDINQERREAASLAMEEFLNAPEHRVERCRDGNITSIDLRPLVNHLDWSETGHVRMSLKVTPSATARPEEVLAAIGLKDLYSTGTLVRHDLILEEKQSSSSVTPNPTTLDPALPT